MDIPKIMKLFSEKNLIEGKIKAAVAQAEKKAVEQTTEKIMYIGAAERDIAHYAIGVFKKEMGEFLQKEFGGII